MRNDRGKPVIVRSHKAAKIKVWPMPRIGALGNVAKSMVF
jgi:hypothetical protein